VLQNILETENEYAKELQTMLSNYLRPLQASEKYVSLFYFFKLSLRSLVYWEGLHRQNFNVSVHFLVWTVKFLR